MIENKVKSLPNHEQIIGYKEKMDNKNQDANFVLISLVEPDNEFRSKVPFLKIINYEQIHNWLSQLETTDKYLRALLEDYGILISTLLQIKSIASDLKLEHQLSFKKEDEKILRDIRLFDVAQKIRYSCFAVLCDKRLDELKLKNLSELKEKTEVALSRSLGLISIKIKFQNPASARPFLIGIQIQGNQYRFLVESTDGSDVQALAEELRKECLWLTSRHGTCEDIRKFGKIFKYTYFLIKEKTIEDLLREVEIDITKLFENKNKIESLIIRMQSNNFHSGELNQAKL